jgi:hypothetical protein
VSVGVIDNNVFFSPTMTSTLTIFVNMEKVIEGALQFLHLHSGTI